MIQKIAFAGGCFWCTEAIFKKLKGVISVTSGYTGGTIKNPTYEQVCSGTTEHAEAILIEFNSEKISPEDLLTVFFFTHDPTTLNRQGNDVGTQYRSGIFCSTHEQLESSKKFIEQLLEQKAYTSPIVTEVSLLTEFYSAETYHQDYYEQNKTRSYCQIIITPKIQKLEERFKELLI